jgi:hypothetical protein
MKYLAIILLSLASLLTAAGASQSTPAGLPALVPDMALAFEQGASIGDRALAGMLAAALIALQLRRRQKSLRMPRALN